MIRIQKAERLDKLEQAQHKIEDAVELIREAVKGLRMERSVEAYIIGHLSNWARAEHTLDDTIPKIYQRIEEGEDD